MKLFGFNIGHSENKFILTLDDKQWVENCFKWLVEVFGHPKKEDDQILFNETWFHQTFTSTLPKVDSLLNDLSYILNIKRDKITYELVADLRDSFDTPYQFEGQPFESATELLESNNELTYKLFIAKSLLNHPKRLSFVLSLQLIKICLTESGVKYDTDEDTDLFVYMAGIYFKLGVILSQNLLDRGFEVDGFWEKRWNYISAMPIPVMTYALAVNSVLTNNTEPTWKNELPKDINKNFEKAVEIVKNSGDDFFNEKRITNELRAIKLFDLADLEYKNNSFDEAISEMQKILFLTEYEWLKASAYINIGYYQLRMGNYAESILNFLKALEIQPKSGYANNNLGFAYIMIDELEKGKHYLERALITENNDPAYSFRNLALFHQKKNEFELAETNFQKGFELKTEVDLLEFFYAKFKFQQDQKEKGMEYLKLAVKKGEPEAISLFEEMSGN